MCQDYPIEDDSGYVDQTGVVWKDEIAEQLC